MITLRDKDNGRTIGTITEEDLAFLTDEMEEESDRDVDYYVDAATIDMLEEDGAPAALTALLRGALAGRDGMDIVWSRV